MSGAEYTIFTDSQAEILRLLNVAPGPGQRQAVEGIQEPQPIQRRRGVGAISLAALKSGRITTAGKIGGGPLVRCPYPQLLAGLLCPRRAFTNTPVS